MTGLGESTFKSLLQAAQTTNLFLEEFCVILIDERIDVDDLTKFLSTQSNSLKKLEIQRTFQITDPNASKQSTSKPTVIYDAEKNIQKLNLFQLKSMTALTYLSFSIMHNGLCPQTENTLKHLPNLVEITIRSVCPVMTQDLLLMASWGSFGFSCLTVTKLELQGEVLDQNIIRFLGIIFPSVKSLELKYALPKHLQIVTTVWPALKHLKLTDMLMKFYYSVNKIQRIFPSLVKLKGR